MWIVCICHINLLYSFFLTLFLFTLMRYYYSFLYQYLHSVVEKKSEWLLQGERAEWKMHEHIFHSLNSTKHIIADKFR